MAAGALMAARNLSRCYKRFRVIQERLVIRSQGRKRACALGGPRVAGERAGDGTAGVVMRPPTPLAPAPALFQDASHVRFSRNGRPV